MSANTFPGFSAPAAGPEAPLEMLAACHGRVERQCNTLKRLVPHLIEHGTDEQARSAASNILRYFDHAAKHHHEDEEADLFPALLESMAGSDAVCIRELTTSLAADHRRFETEWQALREILMRIAAGESLLLEATLIDSFASGYARHIEREESELLPMAARLLGDGQLETIGRAMRARRTISLT